MFGCKIPAKFLFKEEEIKRERERIKRPKGSAVISKIISAKRLLASTGSVVAHYW